MQEYLTAEKHNMSDDSLMRRASMLLSSEVAEASGYAVPYSYIESYAAERALRNTAIALPLVLTSAATEAGDITNRYSYSESKLQSFRHSLSVCRMLIDLHLPLSNYEEDVLLAASLTHILPELLSPHKTEKLMGRYGIDHDVYDTAALIYRDSSMTNVEQKQYFKNIAENRLALLIALADRGNIIEHLYGISIQNAQSFIYETRNSYLPLCIYGKEHYHELLGPISVLMEKMRNLAEVADILLGRFVARETEITQEILALQEENATLTGIIRALEG